MKIQAIGKASYLIVVSDDELMDIELLPDEITDLQAVQIFRAALPEKGESAFLELYQGKGELMMFVRFPENETMVFEFDCFEDMLSAVRLCPEMYRSELISRDGRYILILTPWNGDPIPESLCEFGNKLEVTPECILHLREHAKVIIPAKAVEKLLSVF